MSKCEHVNFRASVRVNRLTKIEGGPVIGHSADLRVYCRDCGIPFLFHCKKMGVLSDEPTTSVDEQELRIPLRPRPDTHPFPIYDDEKGE